MRDIHMSEPEIIKACGVLFPSSTIINSVFLNSIEQDQLKAAFHQKALRTHPDRARALGLNPAEMSRRFQDVSLAYETLKVFLSQRPGLDARPTAQQSPRPTPAARPTTGASSGKTSAKKSTGTSSGRPSFGSAANARNHTSAGASRQKPCASGLTDHYYNGAMPQRELRLGEFIYYSGFISWRALISALVWQKQQRPKFGEIARQWNYLSDEDIEHILSSKTWHEKFGEYALRQGFLSPFQQMAVAGRQKQMQPRIGIHFTQNGLLSAFQLERLATKAKLHNHNIR